MDGNASRHAEMFEKRIEQTKPSGEGRGASGYEVSLSVDCGRANDSEPKIYGLAEATRDFGHQREI